MSRSLPQHPLLKRHLLPVTIGEDENILLSEDRPLLWKGRGFSTLLPYLDGRQTLADLFQLVGEQLTPPEIVYLLMQLQHLGLLADAGESATSSAADTEGDLAFWHAVGVDESAALARMRSGRVRLRAAGGPVDYLEEALQTAGLAPAENGEAALDIVVTDHYFRPELSQVNEAALARGAPWMVCKFVGQTLWIGPIFHPGRTGCMTCLQERLRLNRQMEDFVVRKTGDPAFYATSVGASPIALRLGASWTAQEIALWLAGCTERLEGKMLSVASGQQGPVVACHTLIQRPQCRVCGDPEYFAKRPMSIILQRRPRSATADGAPHTESTEATLRRLETHISPITGVVTWLRDDAQDPEGVVHSVSAGHNFSLGPDTLKWLQRGLRSHARGKGATEVQARASAVCEAIERFCGVFHDGVPRIRATYAALGQRAIHPNRCLNFSAQQYARRDQLNAEGTDAFFNLIPRPFPEELEIEWVGLWSLTHEEVRFLPAALCYYAHPDVERYFYCAGDANGCAAGKVPEEAILGAFLELVERDSVAIWWYNRLVRPKVDLAATADPYVDRVRAWHARHGRELWALDLTSDLGIPVVAAVSRRVDGPTSDLLLGFGAHLDRSTALLRALTELNQFLPAVTRRGPNGETLYAWPDSIAARFWKNETLASQPQLVPDPTMSSRTLADVAVSDTADLYDNVQTCLQIARRNNLEVLALDQSRPDIPMSVFRVVVPGLRHFWRRLGPGRLYDVPVQLGWRTMSTPEDLLNPTSIFF